MEDRKDLFDPSYTTKPQESAFPDPTMNRYPEMPSIPTEVPLQMQGDTSAERVPQSAPEAPVRSHGDTVAEGHIPPTAGYDNAPPKSPVPPAAKYYYPYGNVNANTNPQPNAASQPNAAAYPDTAPQPDSAPQMNTSAAYAQTQSAAYANPYYADLYSGAEMPKQPAEPMNRRIYTMAAIIAALIFLLCLFCIGADLLQGALGTTETGYEVVLNVQPPPELDPEDANVASDGTYTVRGVAEQVKPSIVKVYAFDEDDDLVGTGSGIIVSEDGFIITNAHVVQGETFSVLLDNGDEHEAVIVGSDTKTDLAVLKIEADGLKPATLGDSDKVYVGEHVVAIGNPAGLTNTVTVGIVSAINRQVRADSNAFDMDCIQTDAAISPGNSGGALVNMYGQVIGITSSKYASSYIQGNAYEGLGFAITINEALPIVEELISQGYVSGRFRIGISFYETDNEYTKEIYLEETGEELPEELHGLWIISIDEDCDIYNTQLQANDFIITVNGNPVSNYDDVIAVLDGYKGGDLVEATCARVEDDGSITYFDIEFRIEVDTSGNY